MQRALEPLATPRSDGEDQGVVGELRAAREMHAVVLAVHPLQRVHVQLRALVRCDLSQLGEVGLGEIEGLSHGERLIDEMAIRGDQVGLGDGQQGAQRQQRLHPGDAAAGDDHASVRL